jgi:hypothetical protein
MPFGASGTSTNPDWFVGWGCGGDCNRDWRHDRPEFAVSSDMRALRLRAAGAAWIIGGSSCCSNLLLRGTGCIPKSSGPCVRLPQARSGAGISVQVDEFVSKAGDHAGGRFFALYGILFQL